MVRYSTSSSSRPINFSPGFLDQSTIVIKCFNDWGVGHEPGDFLCGRSVKTDLKASESERIHATDEGFPVHRACGGECILNFSPWDSEKQHICKIHCIPRCARSSMRADLLGRIEFFIEWPNRFACSFCRDLLHGILVCALLHSGFNSILRVLTKCA